MYVVEVDNMGKRLKTNFNKRFAGRIQIVYAKKSCSSEKRLQERKICKAIIKVLSCILGREPTQSELLGTEDVSKSRRKNNK